MGDDVATYPMKGHEGVGVGRAELAIDGGILTVIRFDDGLREIVVDAADPAVRLGVSRTCKQEGGTWTPVRRGWLMALDQAKRVIRRLRARPVLPAPDGPSVMHRVESRREIIYDFATALGTVRAMQLEQSNWALRDQGSDDLASVIEATCRTYGVGEWYAPRANWLIPQHPPELIERVARAIRQRAGRSRES